ncbi:MAG: amine dehydrogenase large subunit [Myxococcota bacterium]
MIDDRGVLELCLDRDRKSSIRHPMPVDRAMIEAGPVARLRQHGNQADALRRMALGEAHLRLRALVAATLSGSAAALLAAVLFGATASQAVEIDPGGQVATMPPVGPHWVFVPDRLLQTSFIFDGDSAEMLGAIPSPGLLAAKLPPVARTRNEIYSVDVDYERGVRGKRTDYVTIYDARSLEVMAYVDLPDPVSSSNTSQHHVALLDGDRFLIAFSQFPDGVGIVVDLEARAVVARAPIAGCAGVYATGPRSFATLCGDGTTVQVVLTEEGQVASTQRSAGFFDVVADPVSMVGVQSGSTWHYVSFLGDVHRVDYASAKPVATGPWSLVSAAEKEEGWRPGGLQPHTLHVATNRLFVLMHEGEPGSHKDASPEIWVYDVETGARLDRFEVPNLGVEFLGPMFGLAPDSFGRTVLGWIVPNEGAHAIVVSQDAEPLLFTRSHDYGVVGVLDADTGEHLRTIGQAGFAGPTLGVP